VAIPPELLFKMEHASTKNKANLASMNPQPTVIPQPGHHFAPEKDAMVLRNAMKGLGLYFLDSSCVF